MDVVIFLVQFEMLTEEQRRLLTEAYENGLTSAGKAHAEQIAGLAASLNISEETVKVNKDLS